MRFKKPPQVLKLDSMPPDIILEIADHICRIPDILHLMLTKRRFFDILESRKYLFSRYCHYWNALQFAHSLPWFARMHNIVHTAARTNDTELLKAFIRRNHHRLWKVMNMEDWCGVNPLTYAVVHQNPVALRWLKRHGCRVPERTPGFTRPLSGTPLLHAVAARNHEMVQLLMDAGSEPSASFHGVKAAALQLAVVMADGEMLRIMLKHPLPQQRGRLCFVLPEDPISVEEGRALLELVNLAAEKIKKGESFWRFCPCGNRVWASKCYQWSLRERLWYRCKEVLGKRDQGLEKVKRIMGMPVEKMGVLREKVKAKRRASHEGKSRT
ncbi:hypothetical protein EX30DRAFT_39148 [Ascodesmis nigricans]|uniref:Uncharacterized protein n=1 Tax=Ascodesmis nigricans TaxID=341454 RepID=A0A4S2MW63_9PEZI|nr:hypothetical protein EX30DRAFT_39148 [Ascodesmis nigricans]